MSPPPHEEGIGTPDESATTNPANHPTESNQSFASSASLHPHTSSSSLNSPPMARSGVDELMSEFASMETSAALEPAYVKVMESDLNTTESLQLFRHLRQVSAHFQHFTDDELRLMSEIFSVLRLPQGEKIITKGETATFAGIVLSGSFSAVVSPTLSVALTTGSMVGEMAFFESMSRSADIVTNENSVLAVLTFEELNTLSSGGHLTYITLQMKLVKMFAAASISKLRSTSGTSTQPSPSSSSSSSSGDSKASMKPTSDDSTKSTKVSSHIPSPSPSSPTELNPSFMNVTRESLYRVRLSLEKDKDAAHRAAEQERQARLKVEKRNQSVGASLDRYRNLATRLKDTLAKLGERYDQQVELTEQVRKEMHQRERQMKEVRDEFDSLHKKISDEVQARRTDRLNADLTRAEDARKFGSTIQQLTQQVQSSQDELAALQAALAAKDEEMQQTHQRMDETSNQHRLSFQELQHRFNKLQRDHEELINLKKTTDESLKTQMGLNSQLSLQLANVKQLLKFEEDKNSGLSTFKAKVSDLSTRLNQDKKISIMTIASLLSTSQTHRIEVNRYRQILKYVLVACFVKLYKLKKSTRQLHYQISELLVNILEGHVLANSAGGSGTQINQTTTSVPTVTATATVAPTTSASATTEASNNAENTNLDSTEASNTANTTTAISDASYQLMKKTLQRKKKDYLDSILKKTSVGGIPTLNAGTSVFGTISNKSASVGGSMKLHDLLQSLEEEVWKLKQPFEEVQHRIFHWKSTSEAFFQRSIALTAEILEMKKKVEQTELQNSTLRTVLQKHNNEYDTVLSVNSSLKLEIARYKNEIQAYRQTTKQLEIVGDVVGTKRAEMENIESKIVLQKAQLQYLQQRYIDTASALNAILTQQHPTTVPSAVSTNGTNSTIELAPPPPPPHYPPPTPSAYKASPSMTQLLNSTLGFTRSGSIESMLSSSPSLLSHSQSHIPLPHESPEAHHIASLRNLTQAQHDLALAEYEKWKRVQFVLENQAEHQSFDLKKGSHRSRRKDPLVAELSSLNEVASLRIDDNYARVFSKRHYTPGDPLLDQLDGGRNVRDGDKDLIFDELPPSARSRAEDEEAKSAMLATATLRVKQIKNNMGRTHQGSARSFYSNNHSRNSTDIAPNGALTSIGGQAHAVVGGGGVLGVLGLAPLSVYSSFVPQPSTSEAAAPGFSRTLMLLKQAKNNVHVNDKYTSDFLPRLESGRQELATVYGVEPKPHSARAPHRPTHPSSSHPSSSTPGSPSSARFHPSGLQTPPSSYAHPSTRAPASGQHDRNSSRSLTQHQSATSLQANHNNDSAANNRSHQTNATEVPTINATVHLRPLRSHPSAPPTLN